MNIYAEDGYEALRVGCTANGNCEGNPDSGITTKPPAIPAGGIVAVIIVLLVMSAFAVAAFFVWQKLKKRDHGDSMYSTSNGERDETTSTYGSTDM